jgi:adenylate cyclase class 2
VTYKGPKEAGPTKTREEIEIPFAPGPDQHHQLSRLLDRLGFRRVAVISKRRTSFSLTFDGLPMQITLDRADGLGDFAEVEALADDRDDLPAAQQAVLKLAEALGLETVEPRSYLRMQMERRAQAST